MLISFVRTILTYTLVMLALRISGKRQVGDLQPSELVVTIMISDLAAIPMQNTNIPLVTGIIPILTLVVLEVSISFLALKSKKARTIISGEPNLVIHNGVMLKGEMERLRMNRDDLAEELRLLNCPDIKDVQYGIVETNGKLSLILKKDSRAATLSDLRS